MSAVSRPAAPADAADRVVELPPISLGRDRVRSVILWCTAIACVVEIVVAILQGGTNRAWALGAAVVVGVGVLVLARRFRIEWRDGVPSLVSRSLIGWRRRIVLDAHSAALHRSQMGTSWVGARRGRRRIWVQVAVRDSVWNAEAPPSARTPEQLEELATALSGCAGGRQVANLIHRHVALMAEGRPVTESPLLS